LAWLWILPGFLSGMVLGMFFHREDWLGGYASLRRRMYRLGHISFFGLGAVNLFFWLTMKQGLLAGSLVKAAVAKIQSYGVTVNGCFILGLDADMPEVFDDVLGFVRDSGLYEVQVTFMTAFPGTPLYARLKQERRIIRDKAWELCTLFDINIAPKLMSVGQLQAGFLKLVKELYSAEV